MVRSMLQGHHAAHLGAMAEQIIGFVLGGHERQPGVAIDRGLQPGTGRQAEGVAQLPGDGELPFGAAGDGGRQATVRWAALRGRLARKAADPGAMEIGLSEGSQ
jgi:hypothetical protein